MMGIVCKICHHEVAALEGGRCRKCRRLVCKDCFSSPPEEGGDIICRECAAMATQAQQAAEQAVVEQAKAVEAEALSAKLWSHLPHWQVAAVMLLLLGIFGGIVAYPIVHARVLTGHLLAAKSAEVPAVVERIASVGGRAVYKEMERLLLVGDAEARLRAILVLGELGRPEALKLLDDIVNDNRDPDLVRNAAREAAIKIREH